MTGSPMQVAPDVREAQARPRASLLHVMVRRLTAIVCASLALGLAYNAASPMGVRWTGGNRDGASAPSPPPLVGAGTRDAGALQSAATGAAELGPPRPLGLTTSRDRRIPTATSWAEIEPRLGSGDVVLVDVRPRTTYDAGHIPGAVSLSFDSTPEEIREFASQYDADRHLVLYCSNVRCGLSRMMAYRLARDHGYRHVQHMPGGYHDWQLAGRGQDDVDPRDPAEPGAATGEP